MQRWVHQYDPDIRFIVCAISMLCCFYLTLHRSPLAIPFFILSALLFIDTLRNSSVWYGFTAFRRGDLTTVNHALQQVRWPQLLSPQSLAYYNWLKGVKEIAEQRYAAAKVHLLVAINGELKTQNDRCLLHCLLAEIALQEEEGDLAREHIKHATTLEHRPEVNRIIQSLTQRLSK
ncbi:MAG: hypothetical protein OQL08_01820 [Gammaproteobacteria bacterium]|nr:hypothetical protein [Gammaproteobacteria bacterium]